MGIRLLLAEDEKALSRALVAILERSSYSVDAVFDGQTALEYLESEEYDGVILDVMMPRLDGFEVLKALRQAGNLVPVLMLTAKSEVDDKVLGLDLVARVRAMTRTQIARPDTRLGMGNLTLDQATMELSSPFGSFRLVNKEYQVLELLMSNPRRLIPTERFLEKIWGYDSDAELNVVWVYISYLRKKLAALHATVQIKATRNAGYTLEETT